MKKIITIILLYLSMNLYSQIDTMNIDSAIYSLKYKNYEHVYYSNINHIQFYNKRIADIIIKIEYVIENEYEEAIKNDWFNKTKTILDDAILQRKKFIKQ